MKAKFSSILDGAFSFVESQECVTIGSRWGGCRLRAPWGSADARVFHPSHATRVWGGRQPRPRREGSMSNGAPAGVALVVVPRRGSSLHPHARTTGLQLAELR